MKKEITWKEKKRKEEWIEEPQKEKGNNMDVSKGKKWRRKEGREGKKEKKKEMRKIDHLTFGPSHYFLYIPICN